MKSNALRGLAAAAVVWLLSSCGGTYPLTRLGNAPVPDVIPSSVDRNFGVALAGGGTKASSYSMGVLGALADANALPKTGAISSVSGGGYAAYFLYSKLLHESQRGVPNQDIDARQFFADCMPASYKGIMNVLPAPRRFCNDGVRPDNERFQRYVRCRQDVVEMRCEQDEDDGSQIANVASLAGGSGFMAIPNFVARSLFDWPVNLAPSRRAYLNGIASTYGLYPVKPMPDALDVRKACEQRVFADCDPNREWLVDRSKLRFADLRKLHEGKGLPLWVLNATATPNRSVFSWARGYRHDFPQHIFRMSPYGMGSRHYGEVSLDPSAFDPLEATVTAAAFLDTNEMTLGQPLRMLAALGQHLAVLDWGMDVANPNVTDGSRLAHTVLPFPLYYADGLARYFEEVRNPGTRNNNSAYIRLVDGGSQDNLGAWTLLEEQGFRTVLISDHAQDSDGKMGDLCALRRQVELHMKDKALHFPALDRFEELCASRASAEPLYYPMHAWTLPVVLGCLSDKTDTPCAKPQTRILLLKPAFDGAAVLGQLAGPEPTVARCDGGYDWGAKTWEIPCEAAAYVAARLRADPAALDLGKHAAFPQNGTVAMTFNSNPLLYGAYKDLAAYQAGLGLQLAFDHAKFDHALKLQAGTKIKAQTTPHVQFAWPRDGSAQAAR